MRIIFYYSIFINLAYSAIEEHKVTSLPGISESLEFDHYSGYLNLREYAGDSRYFYWLFHNKKLTKENKKLLIWLNGGPGCTSADGIILEKGIFNISGDLDNPSDIKLRALEEGWHSFAKVMMVDQPLGTGYSIGQQKFYATSVKQASDYFAMFLEEFFDKYPEYKEHEIYLGGESWAGIWIPYIADKLIKTKSKANLKGLMIGNGWMDPINQYSSYIPYIEKHDILPKDQLDKLKAKYKETCEPKLENEGHKLRIDACEAIISELTEYSVKGEDKDKTCINLYDIRLRDTYPACGMEWPPNVGLFRTYMARPEVAAALHGELPKNHKWQECDSTVYQIINKDPSEPSIELIPELLKTLKLYLFVGDKDLMTPITGIQTMVQKLVKKYPKSLQTKQEAHWYHDERGSPEGEMVIYPALNITFASIFDGSHMVSFDKPSEVSGLFKYFMNEEERLVDGPSFFLGSKKTEEVKEEVKEEEKLAKSIIDDELAADTHIKTASNFYFYIPILIILLGVVGGIVWFIFNRNQHKKLLDIHHPMNEESGLANGEDEILLSDRGGFMDGYEDTEDDEDDDF